MMVRKFYAETAREALKLVRERLGANALILSNRRTARGVEILAVPEGEIDAVTLANAAVPPPPKAAASKPVEPAPRPARLVPQPPPAPAPEPKVHTVSVAAQTAAPPNAAASYDLVQEVRFLRSMLEGQLAAFAWNDLQRGAPAKIEVLRQMLAAGFSAGFSRRNVDFVAPGLDSARALRLVKQRLQQQLRVTAAEQSPVEAGGVYALVGPTGVGKTTTVAKIAAECVLRRGVQSVALVTTDTYRIGAVDQLRIYGRILNAPVFAIRSDQDFASTLVELRARHLVLIDTVGMSQRDRRLSDQIAMLAGTGKPVQRLLLLSAVAQANVLEDVVKAYGPRGLAGCILTKTDETLTLGGALDVLMRHRLPLAYVTNGQRVPEDLHRPNPLYLIERAFRTPADAQPLADADYPLMYAAGVSPALAEPN
jgi:flagellar biosynthesis protein FlhF